MTDSQTRKNLKNIPCPGCGGSGQTSYFGGESRFMLTWEDCPDCCGTGVQLDDAEIAMPEDTSVQRKEQG
jgi:DnaJ-class molecular chaperone